MSDIELCVSVYWIFGCILTMIDLSINWDALSDEIADLTPPIGVALVAVAFVLATVSWPLCLFDGD